MHPGPLSSEASGQSIFHFQIMNINQKGKKVKHQHLLKSFSKVSTIYESEKKKINCIEIQNCLSETTCKVITATTSGLLIALLIKWNLSANAS